MNYIVLVGRLTDNPKVTSFENGNQVSSVILAVQRNYKNVNGTYETDFIKCVLWNGIAERTSEYCKTGDVIGIKGRLQTSKYDDSEGNTHYSTEVVAETVTFLSSERKNDSEENIKEDVKKEKTSKKNKKAE